MNRTTGIIVAFFAAFTAMVSYARADLLINTLEEPPGSFTDRNGNVTGVTVDVVREIQRRLGNRAPIRIHPWARTYQNVLTQPNVLAFTATRTPERETKFHWIAMVVRNAHSFFVRKGSGISISGLDDARALKGIGVLRASVWEEFLLRNGFTNLDRASTHEQNLIKFTTGRFDALYASAAVLFQNCKAGGRVDCNGLILAYTPVRTEAYIIMSKNGTSQNVVNQWKQTAQAMKDDGTFRQIAEKWVDRLRTEDGFHVHYADGALNLWRRQPAGPDPR